MDGMWLIIPAKPFAQGKSRLLLEARQRASLNRAFLTHILLVATRVVPAARIVVVSRDPQALAEARRHNARALAEPNEGDLNDALAMAADYVARRGATRILSLFTDLPYLDEEDVRALVEAGGADRTVVIAADAAGGGTNAMLMPACLFPYSHGAGSFWRHLSAAQDAGHAVTVLRRPGLMTDIDERAQLNTLPPALAAVLDCAGNVAQAEVVR